MNETQSEYLKTASESDDIFRTIIYEYLYKSNYSFGWVAGIGLNFQFDASFISFVECQLNSITFYPDEIEITSIDISTGSRTTVTRYPKEKIIFENADESTTGVQGFPFSSVGIIMGFRYVL